MKIAVIGADGQLGSDVVAAFKAQGDEVISFTHSNIAIEDASSVAHAFAGLPIEAVVNTAAMHHVDQCERDPERAFTINGIGAKNLAVEACKIGAALLHVSTDYVFDGETSRPYSERDVPRPLNAYGITKLAGEQFVRASTDKYYVVRTSGLYGKSPCRAKGGLNFVELMLKLAKEKGEVRVVDSEFVSPTSTAELARQIVKISHSGNHGLYHATAEGSCSWHEFAREIFALTGTPVKLHAARADEFPAKVPRPKYSVLENEALKRQGLNLFAPWQTGLRDYLAHRVVRVEESAAIQTN